MESHQPQKRMDIEGLPDREAPRPRRFRVIKLEERIAPKAAANKKEACVTLDCGGGVGSYDPAYPCTVACPW